MFFKWLRRVLYFIYRYLAVRGKFFLPSWASYEDLSWIHACLGKILPWQHGIPWQDLDKILAKTVPRSGQDLAKILPRSY